MAQENVKRKLTAILYADVAGYSRLTGEDEVGTHRRLLAGLDLMSDEIRGNGGKIVHYAGDAVLADFSSVVAAVDCAVGIQRKLSDSNAGILEKQRLQFRIGVNLGEVIVDRDEIYGDGVNVAARLESLAQPGGICISAAVFEQVKGKLDIIFEDLGLHQLKNIAELSHVFCVKTKGAKVEGTGPGPMGNPLPLPDKPSIAVLPFENMSADPEQEYFSDGITEDIITELSKISGIFVIARHSAFTYKGQSMILKQVGRELGVHYLLEGSVRKAGARLRITAQLINAVTDHHLWAERYDRDLDDIFAVQDEVARKVTEALEVALTPGESLRLARAPTDNLEAYDVYLRARRAPYPPTRHNLRSARTMYERVIEMDPTFAGGYAGKSMMHAMAVMFGHSDQPDTDVATAMVSAQRAVVLDQEFARSYSALGLAYSVSGQHQEALSAGRRAVELQPGDADNHAFYSRCLRLAGRADEALKEIQIALRLDPQFIEGPYLNMFGAASFISGRYDDVVEAYERNSARGGPVAIHNMLNWAAACGITGRLDKARDLVREILKERPDLTLANVRDVHRQLGNADLKRLRAGLRKAGMPE